ncbi:RHS repeat-associated core domain-containing protein, partial [Ferviditalea candida]|nr:RHS repeat-associated core domain-containing protein [Paenibacillaceae bacterium T2]
IGYIGDLGTGNGSPGSLQGPVDENGNIVPDYTPDNNSDPQNGSGGTLTGSTLDGTLSDNTLSDSTETMTDTTTSTSTAGDTIVGVEQEPTEDITTELVKLNPYRYAGYYWDRKTQYYYLQARYYDPRNGRFLSADTYRGEIQNPLSLHLYAYAFNNPVNYVDPSGHDAIIITASAAASRLGHTSVIFQNANGDWYYTYWGDKTVLSMKVDTSALISLNNFNAWLDNKENFNTANEFEGSTHGYTSSTYIKGNFTNSLEYFEDLKRTYDKIDQDGVTTGYRLLYNNCLQQELIALKKGKTNDGRPISDFLTATATKYVTIPNAAEGAFKNEFYNNAFTMQEYTDQLNRQLSQLQSSWFSRFFKSGTIYNIKSLLSEPTN